MSSQKVVADYMLTLDPLSIDNAAKIIAAQMRDGTLDWDVLREASACRQRGSRQHFLSASTFSRIFRRVYPNYYETLRQRSLTMLRAGMTMTEVAKTLGVTRRTIYNWKREWMPDTHMA